jgi:uncharacterized damage-inducible protein DinB
MLDRTTRRARSGAGATDREAERTNGVTYRSDGRLANREASAMNHEPSQDLDDPKVLLVGQIAGYRHAVFDKLAGLDDAQLRARVVPSGWSAIELANHLLYMERRWLEWGFAGQPVDDPNGDTDENDQWRVAGDSGGDATALVEQFAAVADELSAYLDRVAAENSLETRGRTGGRFVSDPPTLGWILLHVLQEYARHLGQLDVVRELIDGSTGE